MSGHADSIRRAREIRKEGVVEDETTFEEEWPEDEEEWGEEEWKGSLAKKILNTTKAMLPRLVDFMIDTAAIVAIPTVVTLSMIALFRTTAFEVYLAAGAATLITIFVSDAKQKLLQRLRLR